MSKDSTLYRQWDMLRLIPRYPSETYASELTNKLKNMGYDINKRSVERDLLMFEGLFGLQVRTESLPYGWSWPRDAAIWNLPAMNDEQALTLYMLERHIKDMLPPTVQDSLAPLLKTARERLKATNNAKALRDWPDKVRAVSTSQPLKPSRVDGKVHESISLALLNNHWLEISYQARGKQDYATYTIQPLALVMRGPMLYLACRYQGHDDDRFIALNRIRKATWLDETFSRPDGYSIDAKIEQGWFGFGDGGQIKVELLFNHGTGEHLLETPLSDDQAVAETRDGRLRITAIVADTLQLKWWIMGFGQEVEVVKPAALRQAIVDEIVGMKRYYF